MLSRLWNFLRGYVIIRVTGFSVERFVNLAVHKGVVFREMARNANGEVFEFTEMQVSVRDFFKLKAPMRKAKCKIKIVKRVGLPFLMRRYRKRKALTAGVLFFIVALFALSNFIWQVNVEGHERLDPNEITAFLLEAGFGFGSGKRGVDLRWLERQLLAGFSEINWVNIEIRGTVATIRITETLPRQIIFDYSAPADIVARKDALIIGVATTSGTPLVRPGDVVAQGDVLVSGMLTVSTPEQIFRTEYVRAEAEVTAKLLYQIEVFVPLQYAERNTSGNIRRFRGVELFGRMFGLKSYDIGYRNFDKTTREWQLAIGPWHPVPFIIHTVEYSEIVVELAQRTELQAQFHANELINTRLAENFGEDVEIIDVNVEFYLEDGFVRALALVTTIENIGEIVFLNIHETENQPIDGAIRVTE